MLTLFHPATGQVRVKGVTSCPNVILHAWLEAELSAILDSLPPAKILPEDENQAAWERWQSGLTVKPTLGDNLPPLRMLLVMDNLAGHLTTRFVVWLFDHGIMPLYTPLSGSWLNMTESIQRILAGRALGGQTPANSAELIHQLVERKKLAFIDREMTSPEGAYYSALDADSEEEEGRFYVWTRKDFDKVLLAFGDANSSALITMPERNDYKYVVMPMRI